MPSLLFAPRLALRTPGAKAGPAAAGRTGLAPFLAALRGNGGLRLAPRGELDPARIPDIPALPVRARLLLLDRLFRAFGPSQPGELDHFIEAYLTIARRGVVRLPGIGGRRLLARTALRALELMGRQMSHHWRAHRAIPAGLWERFLGTFREAATAHVAARRAHRLATDEEATVLSEAGRLLLEAAANPYAWEPEVYPHLERLLDALADELLLFPATSPSAFAESRPGRFVLDAAGQGPPVPPEERGPTPPDSPSAQWWVVDASRILERLEELQRALELGVPAKRVHGLLAEIPEPARRILVRRLAGTLRRTRRNDRVPAPAGRTFVVAGLEASVRFCFAWRSTGNRDRAALDTNVRLQSEVGTRPESGADLGVWETLESRNGGLRLRGLEPSGSALIGHVAVITAAEGEDASRSQAPLALIIRWQRSDPSGGGGTELGGQVLAEGPRDCWCRPIREPGSPLQEHPALLLPGPSGDWDSLLLPPGLYRQGALLTVRTDGTHLAAELIRMEEAGVHFDRVSIRTRQGA